jgi:hypothetical protein
VDTARLILVEGMIGSGKTTTALRIRDWLAGRGEDARVFRETAVDHPIQTRAEDRLRACGDATGGSGEYADDQWRQLAERCGPGRPTIIIEASFLQNSVMPVFIEDAPGPAVDGIFDRIAGQVASAEPLLVYLRPADTAAAVVRVHRARGEPWSSGNVAFVEDSAWARRRRLRGRDAVVGLYEAWEPVAARLYDRYPFSKVRVTDPQDDWPAALARIGAAVRPS